MLEKLVPAIVIALLVIGPVHAGADDYVFEAMKSDVKTGNAAVVTVRLTNKATGKPVPDALIVRTRLDMSPDGMAEHVAPVKAIPGSQPGVYAFQADLSMNGRWLLSIAAKVQGETETVVGKVTFRATK